MFEYFQKGGPLMYALLVCSVVALGIFIERFFYLIKTKRKIEALAKEIESLDYSNIEVLRTKLDGYKKNILSTILAKVVDNYKLPPDILKESIQREANKEIPKLSKFLTALGVIYNIAPMLGLLGTVLGLTVTLQDLMSNPEQMLNGIFMALITTIAGLAIAIPTHIAHSYLTSKVNKIVLFLENKSSTFMEKLLFNTMKQ
jgi:biopolymer transport protein ExbB